MKWLIILCFFLLVGCTYAPRFSMVKDSYNTYAPTTTYSPTYTYSPAYAQPNVTHVTPDYTGTIQTDDYRPKKMKKVKKYRVVYGGVNP